MSSRSKSLVVAAVVLIAAFAFFLTPELHSRTVTSNAGTITVQKSAPVEAMKIVPADVLDKADVRWAPLTGEQ